MGRIEYEGEDTTAEALGVQLAEQAWPGVFAGGKQIVATTYRRDGAGDVVHFRFNDGTEMNIVGVFEVRYKGRGVWSNLPEERTGPSEEDAVQAGTELMTGKFPGAVALPVAPPVVEGAEVKRDIDG